MVDILKIIQFLTNHIKRNFQAPKNLSPAAANVLYTVLSAVLFAGSFSFPGLSFMSFFCLVPLFMVLERTGSWKHTASLALLWGALMTFGLSYWLFFAIHVHFGKPVLFTILFMTFLCALPMGILYMFFSLAYRFLMRKSIIFHAAVIPSLWVVCEFIREMVPVFLPWGLLGYAVTGYTPLIQIADITGIYGVSFILVLTNSLLWYIFKTIKTGYITAENGPVRPVAFTNRRELLTASAILIVLWTGMTVYGLYSTSLWNSKALLSALSRDSYSVSIVQGNFGQRERWKNDSFDERLETYINLSERRASEDVSRIILWPETVLNSTRRFTPGLVSRLISILHDGDVLIAGGLRKNNNNQTFNSAWLVSATGHLDWYDKNIMLPFAESNPLDIRLLGQFYEAPSRYAAGTTHSTAAIAGKAYGLSICFESIYSGYVRDSVKNGAGLLVNLSNDTWFGNSTEPRQHLGMAVMRAVENRRFLLRAANSGISAVISPSGNIVSGSKLFERCVVESRVAFINETTVYHHIGYSVIYFALFVLICCFGLMILKT